jgi:D-alanine transfer protein
MHWDSLASVAEAQYREETRSNPFGIADRFWAQYGAGTMRERGLTTDTEFAERILGSPLWGDLALLLAALREVGARPFVISMPFKGVLLDSLGITAASRATYYDQLRRLTGVYGVPSIDFSAYDGDRYFLYDSGSHPSPKGWVLYDQALDRFYQAATR